LLLTAERLSRRLVLKNRPQAMFHVVEIDRTPELLVKAVKDLALRRFEQVIVSVEELVDNFAAIVLLTDNRLSQVPVSFTP
jgi:hypothetical protein